MTYKITASVLSINITKGSIIAFLFWTLNIKSKHFFDRMFWYSFSYCMITISIHVSIILILLI